MLTRRSVLWLGAFGAFGRSALGCSSDQSLVLVGGERVDAAEIDRNPLRVLPSGALLVGNLDADKLFRTGFGSQAAQVVSNLVPLGAESGFSLQRDVKRVVGAVYAMQGADFCAALQGTFDVAAIERASQARSQTPSGVPLVKTDYGGYSIYTVANIGFVPLTPYTMLSGNETGMRRALDRLRFGPLELSLPGWMNETLANPSAAFAMAGDIGAQGVVDAGADRLPFLRGLKLVRALGNFEPPGVNIVGSLTYADENQAAAAAPTLSQLSRIAYFVSLLSSWGFGGQMPAMETTPQGANVAFATKMDTSLASLLLGALADFTRPGKSPGRW
jgi:hypothetical protein